MFFACFVHSHTCTVQFSRSYVRYYSVFDSNYRCILSLFSSPLNTASMRYLSHADNSYATQILYVQAQMHAHVFLHYFFCSFFLNPGPQMSLFKVTVKRFREIYLKVPYFSFIYSVLSSSYFCSSFLLTVFSHLPDLKYYTYTCVFT